MNSSRRALESRFALINPILVGRAIVVNFRLATVVRRVCGVVGCGFHRPLARNLNIGAFVMNY